MADSPRPPPRPADGENPPESEGLLTDPWSPRPDEALRFFFFEGLLETNSGVRSDVEAALERVEQLDVGDAKLDIDGRRARLMLEEGAVSGEKLDDKTRGRFLHALQEFLDAGGEARGAESTLRCTEVFETRVRETLFRPIGARVEPVARLRGKTPRDEARAPRGIDAPRGVAGLNWRTVAVLLALLFVGFGLSAWNSGWVDRVLAQDAAKLEIDRGAFGDMLVVSLKESWGKYEIEIRRGPSYPADPSQTQAALDAATTNADRACINAVANGDDVYVVVENAKGRAIASQRVNLRPLVSKADAHVELSIWGMMLARKLRLSLDDGKPQSDSK
ncbi:MAG TPA: hypothetical protein VK843_00380 [Planctomycetota bacterium]|nr:hypothetical protein [Planctomycetota bacterium]